MLKSLRQIWCRVDALFTTENNIGVLTLKLFRLHNSCTIGAERGRCGPNKSLSAERNLLIPNNRQWNGAIC
jgi:hypothetical protein